MSTPIPCQRDLFDIPDDIVWLNCSYMSPLMKSAVAAGKSGIEAKAHPWTIGSADFFSGAERARRLFARLINASPDEIAITPSASYGIATAARNLHPTSGNRILLLDEQFPTNVYAWQELAARTDARIETVARPQDDDWTGAILDKIANDVSIVALPNNHWTDGGLIDLEKVGDAVRAVDAALALDVTQSLGAMPLDVRRVRPDFLAAATYKWLLGPYSLGFLFVDAKHHGGEPLEHNWIARAGSEDFAALVNYRSDFQPGARRFDMGEMPNFASLPQAIAALEQILDWGVENIYATLSARNESIAAELHQFGIDCLPAPLRAGHYLGLRFEGGVPAGLGQKLADQNIYVSVRGASMRVTPHLYNDDRDIERFLDALKHAL
jgi:selenocysteine lyase/cysteine desulfurase